MMKVNAGERIGFQIKDNELKLILPIFIKVKKQDNADEINRKIKYFKLLRKYNSYSKESKKESKFEFKDKAKEDYMNSIFEAYYLLLMDYKEFGPFVFHEIKINKKSRGKINWSRTINKSNLIISNDNLIYNNPYYSNKNILYTHPLTLLYGIHLMKIESTTGLKMNLNSQYKSIVENNKRKININSVLDKYKSSMYSDRERKVFRILESINNNNGKLDKVSRNTDLCYLENINNLWEHMLKIVLEDEYYNFNNLFPKGRYDLDIEGVDYDKIGLRMIPDIIKEYKNKLYIIDAKNYLPHINKNIPGSGDINKQILYRYFLSKEFNESNKYELKDIKNVFLLPNDLQGENIKKIGRHKLINTENGMGDISLFQVDFDILVDGFMNDNTEIKSEILQTISWD